jgi:hypothetical protein
MDSLFILIGIVILFVVFIFLMRLLGAWMLRINTVIDNQRILINEVKKMNAQNKEPIS